MHLPIDTPPHGTPTWQWSHDSYTRCDVSCNGSISSYSWIPITTKPEGATTRPHGFEDSSQNTLPHPINAQWSSHVLMKALIIVSWSVRVYVVCECCTVISTKNAYIQTTTSLPTTRP